MLRPWWEQVPERLEYELEALRSARVEFSRRDEEFVKGVLVLDLRVPLDGEVFALRAEFPDFFPYVRPEVYAEDLSLDRHQNPFGRNLCLLGRRSDEWEPEMTLAQLVTEQLRQVLAANQISEPSSLSAIEEHQGEPITAFYSYAQNGAALIEGSAALSELPDGGRAVFATAGNNDGVLVVRELRGPDGAVLYRMSEAIVASFSNLKPGRWVRLDRAIRKETGAEFDAELVERRPALRSRNYVGDDDFVLIAFPDELQWLKQGLNWVLLVRRKIKSKASFKNDERYLLRVQRIGQEDRSARVPEASALATKRVAVFGLGCLGAPVALELARCGLAELRLLDPDVVDAATAVRWPFGLPVAGQLKVEAVALFIKQHYPWTRVRHEAHRLGQPKPGPRQRPDMVVISEVLESCDLLVDATAEFGIQRMLSDLALQHGVPYVGLYATLGGVGGRVFRLARGRTGCWRCIRLYELERTIAEPPSREEESLVQPAGCDSRTYTGGSFDLAEISALASRLIVSTLVEDERSDFSWDVATVSLRNGDGRRTEPVWQVAPSPAHATCALCPAR